MIDGSEDELPEKLSSKIGQPSTTDDGDETPLLSEKPQYGQSLKRGLEEEALDLRAGSEHSRKRARFDSRAPKATTEAQKVSEKLVSDPESPNLFSESTEELDHELASLGEPAWRSKLVLKAVECVWEGMELSTPPYPFVQRWDPQQKLPLKQHNGDAQRKKKKNAARGYAAAVPFKSGGAWAPQYGENGDESSFLDYGDDSQSNDVAPRTPNLQQQAIAKHRQQSDADYRQQSDADYRQQTINEDINRLNDIRTEKKEAPDDLTYQAYLDGLPTPEVHQIIPGAVIAFKQLELSEATSWSPELSNYRQAKVLAASPAEEQVSLQLGKRDIPPRKEIKYDREGNRIYGKFEVAESSGDEESEEDDGTRTLDRSEIYDMKLVRPAPGSAAGENGVQKPSPLRRLVTTALGPEEASAGASSSSSADASPAA